MRQRAAWLTQVQHTQSQDNLPELGKKSASNANRHGMAERCADPAVPQRVAVDRALLGS